MCRRMVVAVGLLIPASGWAQAPRVLEVLGLDYAFSSPDTVPPGLVQFAFANRGKVPHELILARLKPGVTLDSVLRTPRMEAVRLVDPIGVLFAMPAATSLARLEIQLAAGDRVALLCFFQDAPTQPPHTAMGMAKTLLVR